MTTTQHQALADRIKETILAAQRVGREDISLDLMGAETDLRRAYARVADRIAWLRCAGPHGEKPSPAAILRELQAARARYPKERRRWLLGRLIGLG